MSANGNVQNDPENEMWNVYLDEVKEDDKRMADAWKEDATGILVFTGLFSAIVGTFIIEFYKNLLPHSDPNTLSLPRNPMIWVNAMWLISLVLSLTSALVATLLQQWARRYIDTPKVPKMPNDRARVRLLLSHGTKSYKMPLAVDIAPTLLHLSVFLFFGGLVITFHTINPKVAIAVYVAVGLSGLAYIVITVFPFLDIRCPYRTPMSYILWFSLHAILSFVARVLQWFLEKVDQCLGQPIIDNWSTPCQVSADTHWRYVKDGFEKSIIQSANNLLQNGDLEIITWVFTQLALYDKSKLQKFVANMPWSRVLELIPLIESGTEVVRDSLLTLLRSCTTDAPRSAEPNEDALKRSLLVCLDTLHHIAKSPNIHDLDFMRANFAEFDLMQALWDNSDATIRVTSRSICALLAKKVVEQTLYAPQLRWLQEVTGEDQINMFNARPPDRKRKILKSFVYGVLSNEDGNFPTESFKETLAILLDVGDDVHFDKFDSKQRLREEVEWIRQHGSQSSRVVDKLRSIFPFLPPSFLQM